MKEKSLILKLNKLREEIFLKLDNEDERAILKLFENTLLTLRIHLFQELQNIQENSRLIGFEVVNKNTKSFRYLFRSNKQLGTIVQTLNSLLRWQLEIKEAENRNTMDTIKPRDLKLFNISLTSSSDDLYTFRANIMKSLWIISYYLAPHWPSEKKQMGETIDFEFSRKLGVEKQLIIDESKNLDSYKQLFGESEEEALQKLKKNKEIISDIISNFENEGKKELKIKDIMNEASRLGLKQGETESILRTLHNEQQIILIDYETVLIIGTILHS